MKQNHVEANFSTLVLSLGSTAAMAMGLAPNPNTGKIETDREVAKFNIDLLVTLQEKTKNNLSSDEENLIKRVVTDLQLKFVQLKK